MGRGYVKEGGVGVGEGEEEGLGEVCDMDGPATGNPHDRDDPSSKRQFFSQRSL